MFLKSTLRTLNNRSPTFTRLIPPLVSKRLLTSPNPADHKPTLPPPPPPPHPSSSLARLAEGSSNVLLPSGGIIALALAVGAYVWTREKNEVTGGDPTKGPKDGQPSRMAG